MFSNVPMFSNVFQVSNVLQASRASIFQCFPGRPWAMAAMVGRWVSSWQGTDPGLVTHDLRIEATESVGLFFAVGMVESAVERWEAPSNENGKFNSRFSRYL